MSKASSALQKAVVILRKLNSDEKVRLEAERRERDVMFYESNVAAHRAEGIAEGEAKGRIKGIAEGKFEEKVGIARSLLNYGIDINIISKSSGLSIEEIEKLK